MFPNEIDKKTCTKCGERKSLSGFHKSNSTDDGLHTICKECRCKVSRKYKGWYYKTHKDTKIKQYIEDNAEKISLYQKEYRTKNKEYF